MTIDRNLVRYSWSEESLNKDCEYVKAIYSSKYKFVSNPTDISISGANINRDMFDFCGSISRIPGMNNFLELDSNFVRKHSFFKFSSSFYLDYCWDCIDDLLYDRLDDYKFSVYHDSDEDCIYLMDNIKVMDVLVDNEIIEIKDKTSSYCEADITIGFLIEETKNKEEIINILVENLSYFREDDACFSFLNEAASFNTYMPSSSYEVGFRDEIVGTDLIEAIRKKYEYWKNKYDNFEEAVRKALCIKEGIDVKIDYNILYASGIRFNIDPNMKPYCYDIDFTEVEESVLLEKVSERNFEKQLDMDKIKSILEDYRDELEDAEISIYQSESNNKIMYVAKENEIYRIPAYILFHAMTMQDFYCFNEIHSFIDTLIDAANILEFYDVNNRYNCEYFDSNDLELVIGNNDIKEDLTVKELYANLLDIATFIKHDSDDRTKIKVAIRSTFFEDLWNYRDKIEEIVTENTKDINVKDVTVDFYVSTYETMEDIENNSKYPFSGKCIYVDEELAKSNRMYLYAEINLQN